MPLAKLDKMERCYITVNFAMAAGCSVAQRVQRGSVVSALACCKSGPSSNLGSAPMEVPSTEPTAVKIWRWPSANVYE
jgi:hypothetical protein